MLRTCLTTQRSPEIQVKSCFLGLLGRVRNTSLTKHRTAKETWVTAIPDSPSPLKLDRSI